MQIHELTRRKTNEGFGTALANQMISKALGGTNPLDQSGTPQSREQGFASMVDSPAAKALATTMQAAWAQTVKNFLANAKDSQGNPATSVKSVTQPSVDALKNELHLLINRMVSGGSRKSIEYTTMANNIGDPVAKQGVQEIVARINEYIETIFKATVQGVDPKALALDWTKLVGDGILPAQNAMKFDQAPARPRFDYDAQGRMIVSIDGQPYVPFDSNNEKHKAIAVQMGMGKAQ